MNKNNQIEIKHVGNGFILEIQKYQIDDKIFLYGKLIPPYEIKPIPFLKGKI